MFYIFYGEDELTIAETVRGLRDKMASADPMAELNTSSLDGRGLTVGQLQTAADAAPFMGERRLVVVDGLIGRCNPRGGDRSKEARKALSDGLKAYLPNVPPTTRLVFVEGELSGNNPILRWAKRLGDDSADTDAVVLREFSLPHPRELPNWLVRRAAQHGGEMERAAASALAEALVRDGELDLRLADSELVKLLTYADDRAVTADDVGRLVTPIAIDSIFRLVDALAERNGPDAAALMHRFLDDGEHPLRLLALIARQFRLLTQTRSMIDRGVPQSEMGQRLPVPPFVVRKLRGQAQRFSLPFLRAAMRRLLEIDVGVKTGRMDAVLGLDLFIAGVCGTPDAQPRRRTAVR